MHYIDVFVDPNPNTDESCGLRFKAEGEPRPITHLMYDNVWCAITGWSSNGGGSPCPAFAIVVEDSSAGTSLLIYGGDWGLRLVPPHGKPFGEAYLLLERGTETA